MSGITSAKVVDRAVEVGFTDGKIIRFEDCWLRDHCRCSKCYHADTFQRAIHILDIPDSKVSTLIVKDSNIHITWDDSHETTFESSFLHRFEYKAWIENNKLRPVLWKGSEVAEKVARVPIEEFLNSVDGATAVFRSLLEYGVVIIYGVEPTLEATEVVCKALGGVQNTFFGAMWKFTTRVDHADTAYTNIPLAVHHDNTYFTEAAGLQIFQCLEHTDGKGGETILADGFHGATLLKAEHPDDFKFLTEFQLEGQYIEEGHHHKNSAPVIILDGNGDLKQISYGGPDSAQVTKQWSVDWGTSLVSRWGVAVAHIDGRGSGLRGVANTFALNRRLGSVEIEDQINVTRYLQTNLPWLDANRTCIWGWSYGGYASSLALARGGDVFRCAIAVAPVVDWRFYDTIYTERYMDVPLNNTQGYADSSLLTEDVVEAFRNKRYFLVHGTADDNVHYQHSMLISRLLQRRDVYFTQMSYTDEDHGLVGVRPHLYHALEKFLQDNML